MSGKEAVSVPTAEDEALLNSIMENQPDEVTIRGKKVKVRWMRAGTLRKLSRIVLKDGNDSKLACQCAAAILLNGWLKIGLLWWLKWRWMYYVKEYSEGELLELIETAKKKVPAENYLRATMYLIAMRDTVMTMTKEEARHILRGLYGDKDGN